MDEQEANNRFYRLIWPHRAAVLRVARILTNDDHEAEDLAQETLMKAFKGIDRFATETDAKKWLMAILRNSRIDRLRAKSASAGQVSLDQLMSEPPDLAAAEDTADDAWQHPQEVLERFSDRQVIHALQALPEELRWTLLLVDVEGVDHQEAAALLDVPVGTIKSRTHRGRAVLRQALSAFARERRLVRD